jgi:hypothetical protein
VPSHQSGSGGEAIVSLDEETSQRILLCRRDDAGSAIIYNKHCCHDWTRSRCKLESGQVKIRIVLQAESKKTIRRLPTRNGSSDSVAIVRPNAQSNAFRINSTQKIPSQTVLEKIFSASVRPRDGTENTPNHNVL